MSFRALAPVATVETMLPSSAQLYRTYYCADTKRTWMGQGVGKPLKLLTEVNQPLDYNEVIRRPMGKWTRWNQEGSYSDTSYDCYFGAYGQCPIRVGDFLLTMNQYSNDRIAESEDGSQWWGRLLTGYRNHSSVAQFDDQQTARIVKAGDLVFLIEKRNEVIANYSHWSVDGRSWSRCVDGGGNPLSFSDVVWVESRGKYYAIEASRYIMESTDGMVWANLWRYSTNVSRLNVYQDRWFLAWYGSTEVWCIDITNGNETATSFGISQSFREAVLTNDDHLIGFYEGLSDQQIVDIDLKYLVNRGVIGDCTYFISTIRDRLKKPAGYKNVDLRVSFDYNVCWNRAYVEGALVVFHTYGQDVIYSADHGRTWNFLRYDPDYGKVPSSGLPQGIDWDEVMGAWVCGSWDQGPCYNQFSLPEV